MGVKEGAAEPESSMPELSLTLIATVAPPVCNNSLLQRTPAQPLMVMVRVRVRVRASARVRVSVRPPLWGQFTLFG